MQATNEDHVDKDDTAQSLQSDKTSERTIKMHSTKNEGDTNRKIDPQSMQSGPRSEENLIKMQLTKHESNMITNPLLFGPRSDENTIKMNSPKNENEKFEQQKLVQIDVELQKLTREKYNELEEKYKELQEVSKSREKDEREIRKKLEAQIEILQEERKLPPKPTNKNSLFEEVLEKVIGMFNNDMLLPTKSLFETSCSFCNGERYVEIRTARREVQKKCPRCPETVSGGGSSIGGLFESGGRGLLGNSRWNRR